jgi:hypothetical protein
MNTETSMTNKLVKEILGNTFSRGGDDKISSLGIGKISLIKKWLEELEIDEYRINDDFSIDIEHTLTFHVSEVDKKFPDYIQFGTIQGNFIIEKCNLETLRGCPYSVFGSFFCEHNNLTSLKYAPTHVRTNFYCSYNKISVDEVNRYEKMGYVAGLLRSDFDKWVPTFGLAESFTKNNKTKLEGLGLGKKALIRKWLEDHKIFNYKINDDLSINVKGDVVIVGEIIEKLPNYIQFNEIDGKFKIKFCELASLKGFPIKVFNGCSCAGNKLESLEYCPKFIGNDFFCDGNLLKDLKFIPENVGGEMYVSRNSSLSLNDILTINNETCYKIISHDYPESF